MTDLTPIAQISIFAGSAALIIGGLLFYHWAVVRRLEEDVLGRALHGMTPIYKLLYFVSWDDHSRLARQVEETSIGELETALGILHKTVATDKTPRGAERTYQAIKLIGEALRLRYIQQLKNKHGQTAPTSV